MLSPHLAQDLGDPLEHLGGGGGPVSRQRSGVIGPSGCSSWLPRWFVLTARFAVCGDGEVVRAEGCAPDAVEVVLRAAEIKGQGLIEQPQAGEGFLQPVDRAGGRLEDLVEVVGGGVVGGAFGDGAPLFLLAAP